MDPSFCPFLEGVQNKLLNVDESVYIPITKAEFAVLTSAFNFIVPYLIGWHAFASIIRPDDLSSSNNVNLRSGADYEWGR
ncbi:Single-stranded DNA-binding protein why1, chloroplastic [Asimina triloba]